MTPPRPIDVSQVTARVDPRLVPKPTARSAWGSVAVVLVLLLSVPLLQPGFGHPAPGLLWILVPGLAAAAWARAAARSTARVRTAFWAFSLGALTGMAAHLLRGYRATALLPFEVTLPVPFVLPYLAIAAGALLVLGSRDGRFWVSGLAADASLLVLVALAAVLRLFVEPILAAGVDMRPGTLLLTLGETAAIIPVVFAALVVLRRDANMSPWATTLLLLATLALALGELLQSATATLSLSTAPPPLSPLELCGWTLFAAAALMARRFPSTAPAMLARRRIPDALRHLVMPAAALFLAVAVVDISLGRDPRPETVGAVALLAALLAIRSGRAFSLDDRDSDRLRQIAYTRTLVDVTHALAGTTDLDATLRIISESARDVFRTRGAGIELVVDDGTSLETRAAIGLPDHVIGLRFPVVGSFTGWVVRHGEPRATVDPTRDRYIQPQSLSFLGQSPVAAAPIQFHGETMGALYACIRSEAFGAEELELMGAMAEQAAIAIQQARLFEQVTTLSLTDPLTGLANRRQLEAELDREFAAARRGRGLAVVMLDLDQFKAHNDTYGHLAGDDVLRCIGEALRRETRAVDVAARYGGDEFVAVLSDGSRNAAAKFGERVQKRFAELSMELGNGPVTLTVGVATYRDDMSGPADLLAAADADLYRTKPAAHTY